MNNIAQTDWTVQEESTPESKNAGRKNGFVHSGSSPTQAQDSEVSSNPTPDSCQGLTSPASFYTASGSSPTDCEWLDVCDRCGARRRVKTFCLVFCIEGRVEQVTVCSSCRLQIEGGKSHE